MRTKLFVGTRCTPELKSHLEGDTSPLVSIPYNGKEYLGYYLESDHPTVQEVRAACDAFLLKLQHHCPEQRVDNLQVVVFPQLFVG
ncbi:MAG: hypothetical protein JJU12_00565 [Chlamydiales bacterium]|nr:hypothetical protein [Chlamydiales bacterium]